MTLTAQSSFGSSQAMILEIVDMDHNITMDAYLDSGSVDAEKLYHKSPIDSSFDPVKGFEEINARLPRGSRWYSE